MGAPGSTSLGMYRRSLEGWAGAGPEGWARFQTLLRALRAVTAAQPEQVAPIVAILTTTMCQMGPTWRVLQPLAARTFRDVGLAPPSAIVAEYERLLPLALGGDTPALLAHLHAQSTRARKPPPGPPAVRAKKLPVAQGRLRKLWEFRQRVTKDDWVEWMRRLSVELLRESPSPALRACAPVAQMHGPLARRLFQVGAPRACSHVHVSCASTARPCSPPCQEAATLRTRGGGVVHRAPCTMHHAPCTMHHAARAACTMQLVRRAPCRWASWHAGRS